MSLPLNNCNAYIIQESSFGAPSTSIDITIRFSSKGQEFSRFRASGNSESITIMYDNIVVFNNEWVDANYRTLIFNSVSIPDNLSAWFATCASKQSFFGEVWYLNNSLSGDYTFHSGEFISNNYDYSIYDNFTWSDDSNELIYSDETIAYSNGTWNNDAYRTLIFDEPTSGDGREWLKNNATRVTHPKYRVTDLTNTTWLWNDVVMFYWFEDTEIYNITFRDNSGNYYTSLKLYGSMREVFEPESNEDISTIRYISSNSTLAYLGDEIYVYETEEFEQEYTWYDNNYKTITITGGSDVENSNLIRALYDYASDITIRLPASAHMFTKVNSAIKDSTGRVKVYNVWRTVEAFYSKVNNVWITKPSLKNLVYMSNDPPGSTVSGMPGNSTFSSSFSVSSIVPICDDTNYVFLGWSSSETATESSTWYDPNSSGNADDDVLLYAQWYDLANLETKLYSSLEAPSSTSSLGDFSIISAAASLSAAGGTTASSRSASASLSPSTTYQKLCTIGWSSSNMYWNTWSNNGSTAGIWNSSNSSGAQSGTFTQYYLAVNKRTGTSYTSNTLNTRILNLIKKSETCLRTSDLTVEVSSNYSITASAINNYSYTISNSKSGYSYIGPMGWFNTDSSNWAYQSFTFLYRSSSSTTAVRFRYKLATAITTSFKMYGLFARVRTSSTTSYSPDTYTYGSIGKANYVKLKELENVYLNSFIYTDFSAPTVTATGTGTNYATASTTYTPASGTRVIGVFGSIYNGTNRMYASSSGQYLSSYNSSGAVTVYDKIHGNWSKSDGKWYNPSSYSSTLNLLCAKYGGKSI